MYISLHDVYFRCYCQDIGRKVGINADADVVGGLSTGASDEILTERVKNARVRNADVTKFAFNVREIFRFLQFLSY